MRGQKVWSAVIVGAGCALIVAFVVPSFASTLSPGDLAPDFTLHEFGTDNEVSLYDFEGHIVLLEFFAYWGSACRTASAELESYVQQYYDSLGGNATGVPIEFVSINIQANAVASTVNYINAYGLDLVLDDPDHEVYDPYGGTGVPQFAIINGARNTNFDQWEIVAMPRGYLSNNPDHDYRAFRRVIERIARVPEPSTFAVLIVGGMVLICRRRILPIQ